MKLDRKSLGIHFLLPIVLLISLITLGLVLMANRVTDLIQDDYEHFTVAAVTSHVTAILEMAAADLTTSKLTGNPVVVEAKKKSVLEAIKISLLRSRHNVIIAAADGTVLSTTLDPATTRSLLANRIDGEFTFQDDRKHYHCMSLFFPLWGWYVTTITDHAVSGLPRKEVSLILPGIMIAFLLLAGGLFLIYRRSIQQPVSAMVANVSEGIDVAPTGISEFDAIGKAVNDAFNRERDRTEELEIELGERMRAENMLRDAEERVSLILRSIAEGIYGVDLEGKCTFCNPAALRLFGFERQEDVLGKKIHELVHHTRQDGTHYPEAECKVYQCYATGDGCHADDEVFWHSDGTSFPVEYWSQPVLRDGAPIGAVTAFVDISERKRLEAQLRQSQKMESIGTLAGGVAHDFNNILSAILGYAHLSLMKMPPDDPQRPNIQQILESANRAAHLTRDLLLFSRKQPIDRKPVDLNEIIQKLSKFLVRVIGEDITLKTILSGGTIQVHADSHQIEQVMMNLATNARDAMPTGGTFTISTEQVLLNEDLSSIHELGAPGNYAQISVSDTGGGMNEETARRIFEPFFTTKEVGKGTGLGLSVVYGIVKQHDGSVTVHSELGRGTTFRIYLPVYEAPAAEETPPAAEEPPVGGTETILLAEDDRSVREMILQTLQDFGYTVITAVDGLDTVQKFRENRDRIQLLLLDLIMPKKTGKDAYDEIREMSPAIKVIFSSGYDPDIVRQKTLLEQNVPVIYKPVPLAVLLKMIRSVLNGAKE